MGRVEGCLISSRSIRSY